MQKHLTTPVPDQSELGLELSGLPKSNKPHFPQVRDKGVKWQDLTTPTQYKESTPELRQDRQKASRLDRKK